FELATGQRPFRSDNLMGTLFRITHEEAELGLVTSAPQAEPLLAILQRALRKPVDERYQTAEEFAQALRTAFPALGAPASAAGPPEVGVLTAREGPTLQVPETDRDRATLDLARPSTVPGETAEAPATELLTTAAAGGVTEPAATARPPDAAGRPAAVRPWSRPAVVGAIGAVVVAV